MRRTLRTSAYLTASVAAPHLVYAFHRKRHHHAFGADELHRVDNGDGFRLALWRFRAGAQRGPGATTKHPVLLCPGLGANRFSFEPHPDHSLADHLRQAGFDTWVLELRGHGASDRANRSRPFGWSFDDHLIHDVPAAIAGVRRLTGAPAVHWVGHSMGGILLYAHLARQSGRGLRSGIAIGSSLDYSGSSSWFHALSRLRHLGSYLSAIPIGALQTMASPFGPNAGSRLDEFNIWVPNTDPKLWRKLQAIGWHSVSANVMLQLATAFDEGGLTSFDGQTRYVDCVGESDVPILAVAGSVDRQCPPSAAARTAAALSHPESGVALFGREHGHADEYGHFDLLMGRRARAEVWPDLVRWLVARD